LLSPRLTGVALRSHRLLSLWSLSIPQSDWLQRLAALDVVGQCAAYLRHKSALILRIAQGSRSEFGGA
jgi:hypothetical protein